MTLHHNFRPNLGQFLQAAFFLLFLSGGVFVEMPDAHSATSTTLSGSPCLATTSNQAASSSLVFDVKYFKEQYPDMAKLSDAEATTYWLDCGINEGRRGGPLFWTQEYLTLYPYLVQPGAAEYDNALQTYVTGGGYGGGLAAGGQAGVFPLASNVFNIGWYDQNYPVSGGDSAEEINWIENGLAQGQQSAPWFSTPDYLFLNQDKAAAFGNNYQNAMNDYQALSFSSNAAQVASVSSRITSFSLAPAIFDQQYFLSYKYCPSFPQDTTCNPNGTGVSYNGPYAANVGPIVASWLDVGIPDGYKGSPNFSAKEYLQMNSALLNAQLPSLHSESASAQYLTLLRHYVEYGRSQGLPGLLQIPTSYLNYVPKERAGLTLHKQDHVVPFSAAGTDVAVIVQAPNPAHQTTIQIITPPDAICEGTQAADTYFNTTFIQQVSDALNSGVGTVQVRHPGDNQPCQFLFNGLTGATAHVTLSNVADLTIDFHGALFKFTKPMTGMALNNFARVVMENFTIDWPSLRIASIGKITVDSNGNHNLQIIRSYPNTPLSANDHVIQYVSPWDEAYNTWGPNNLDENSTSDAAYIGNQTYSASEFANYKAGAILIAKHYIYEGTAIVANGMTDVEFLNVNVNTAPGMGLFVGQSTGVWINNYNLATQPGRVISAAADGINMSGTYSDTIVENSHVGGQGDDGLNIGGSGIMSPILASPTSSVTITQGSSTHLILSNVYQAPVAGDWLMLLNSALGTLGYVKVTAETTQSDGNYNVTVADLAAGSFTSVKVTADTYVQDLSTVGARYIIQSNFFHNNRERGIVDQSPYGLIQENKFYAQSLFAVLIGSLNDVAPGCGVGVQDLTFQNNLIESSQGYGINAGAVVVTSYLDNELDNETGSSDVPINQNILFSQNTFKNLPGPALFIGSAQNISVKNNSLINTNLEPGYYLGTANTQGSVIVSQAHTITGSGNTASGATTGPVSIDSHSASDVSIGLESAQEAQTAPLLTASPNHCPAANNTICTSTINWNNDSLAEVWVQMDGGAGPGKLFTCGNSGAEQANWIVPGHTYVFTLYPATSCTSDGISGAALATTSVQGVPMLSGSPGSSG